MIRQQVRVPLADEPWPMAKRRWRINCPHLYAGFFATRATLAQCTQLAHPTRNVAVRGRHHFGIRGRLNLRTRRRHHLGYRGATSLGFCNRVLRCAGAPRSRSERDRPRPIRRTTGPISGSGAIRWKERCLSTRAVCGPDGRGRPHCGRSVDVAAKWMHGLRPATALARRAISG